MKHKVSLFLLCLLSAISVIAQSDKVSGVITDIQGEPVIGASVVVKGTTNGTVSDIDGKFTINAKSGSDILVFSLIGMKAVEIKSSSNMKVTMEEDSKVLDDVVVTGYGDIKKSSFTGSASVLSTSKLQNLPNISMEAKLSGAAAGVQMSMATGQPGAVESIRIRGAGSITASNEPLYVLDGVPMVAGNANNFTYTQSGNSILSTLNTNDIESITVIKDAAAASLYGSRAANGVVVITTKSGKQGKTSVNLRADWGMSNMAINYRPTLNGDDRRNLLYQGLINYAENNNRDQLRKQEQDPNYKPKLIDPEKNANENIDNYAKKPWSGWTDWRDYLLRTGKQSNYEVSVQAGNDKTSVFTSLTHTDFEGITLQSDLKRTTARLNVNHKANKLHLGANVSFTNTAQNASNEGTSFSSPIMGIAMTTSPQDYPYNEDGSFNLTNGFLAFGKALANPLYSAKLNYNKSTINRFLGAMNAKYDLYDGLFAKQTISYDFIQTDNRAWWDPRSNDGIASNGVYQRYMANRYTLISQTHLGYNKSFVGNHNIEGLLGYETEQYTDDYTYANGSGYPNYNKPEVKNASITRAESYYTQRRMISYVGYANYNYASKYYASASLRRDGSSKFGPNSRWGNFWSLSGSWRITEEPFTEKIKTVLSDAKLRMSYGVNGNLPIDNYEYLEIFKFGYNYNGLPGSAEARLAYNDLTWEKNYNSNLGLDLTFIDRINLTLDLYNRDTKNLLIKKSTSKTTGFTNSLMNLGEMNNRGIEISVTSRNIISRDFNWSTTLNIAHNRNELKKLDGVQSEMILESARLLHAVGKPFSSIYAYEYAGVDPETGKELYYKNKPGQERETTTDPSQAQQVIIGKVDPTVQGGIINNFTYKEFDLGFTFTYSLGGHLYDNASWINSNGGSMNYNGNIPAYNRIENMWTKPGDNSKLPQFAYGNTYTPSSRWMYSTNHLRLKNITLGYRIPHNALRKVKLDRVRLYASAINLLTFKSKDLYLDPEIPVDPTYGIRTYGIVTYQTPPLRTVTFGIEVGF